MDNYKTLARTLSLVENEAAGFEEILQQLQPRAIPVVGFTGPPGAGKSTLLNAVVGFLLEQKKRVGLILVDPSSPFNFGALLGDRLRLSALFNHPDLFIRSVATRGSLGGLSDKIIELTEVMKSYPFDYIFIETVGVGQSEVEIAGLADITVVVLVPESGDSIQTMKAGLMEIADLFVINKADRPGADELLNSLAGQLRLNHRDNIPIQKTIATQAQGAAELVQTLKQLHRSEKNISRHLALLTAKALRLIARIKMKDIDENRIRQQLAEAMQKDTFNLYSFVRQFLKHG